MQRKIRVLVGKPGLDGHDRGAKVVAAALRDAGMEVIYTGLHQSAEQIVEAAVQEDVDVVALSILSGAHMTLFPDVLRLMRARGIGDRLLTGGGIVPHEDMAALAKLGVGRLFGPGSSTQDIVQYIRDWFVERYGEAALAPVRAARDRAQTDLFEAPSAGATGGAPGAMPVPILGAERLSARKKADRAARVAHLKAEVAHHKPAAKGATKPTKAAAKPAKKAAGSAKRKAKPAKKAAKPKRTAPPKRKPAGRAKPARKKRPAAKKRAPKPASKRTAKRR